MDYILSVTPYIASGALVSAKIYIVTIILAIPLGIMCAMGKQINFKPLNWLLEMYTWIFRGTPLLLQLFFVYYGLPTLGIEFSSFTAAYVTFILNYGAYLTEIFRAGIQSIDNGQYEAAKALGMNYRQTMKRIVLPQAIKVVVPPTGNEAINLIKDTALCSIITLPDIMKNAKVVVSRDFDITAFFIAAVLYLIMTFVIINVVKQVEKRFAYYR